MKANSTIAALALAALTVWDLTALGTGQPIDYSHKVHIGAGLQCLDCHSGADVSARAMLPSVAKCMLCHAKNATNQPEIKKIAEYASAMREIPWERVYGFESSAFVKFRHSRTSEPKSRAQDVMETWRRRLPRSFS